MATKAEEIKKSYQKSEAKFSALSAEKRALFSRYQKKIEAYKLQKIRLQISKK